MLVHCQGGVSRSAAITIAYLMYHMKLPLKDAYKFVKDKRPLLNLNFHQSLALSSLNPLLVQISPKKSTSSPNI